MLPFDLSKGAAGNGPSGTAVGAGNGAALLAAVCDVIDVAAVEERASERDVEQVDRFFSYVESEGELEKSLTESCKPSSSSPPSVCPRPKSKLGSSGISGSRAACSSFSRCLCFWKADMPTSSL